MRVVIAILAIFFAVRFDSNGESESRYHTIFWKNKQGQVVYEGHYRVGFQGHMPVLTLVKSFRHGPFVYRCAAPERIDHGNGIFIRNYLPQPVHRRVPPGFKVCLQPAFVRHGPIPVLPYLYLGAQSGHCLTAHPELERAPVFYRPAPLIPAGH